MITIEQPELLMEQYTNRGVLKKEIRSYEVSLWTLQDSFITVLKWADVEQKGRIEQPKMVLKTDGTQNFTFSVPIYYYHNGEKIDNPNWYSVLNGNQFTSMRKIKVIFNKKNENEAVFEFLITNITESHENDIATCEVSCEGLAFHELGKIGYTKVLSQDIFEIDYKNWVKAGAIGNPPIQSLNYWCEKAGLLPRPINEEDCNTPTWYYKVEMNWSSFSDSSERDSGKIYEESYVSSWNTDLTPKATAELVEKARAVKVENSNVYNITQTIAEAFRVFCRYEYGHDENYNITSRTVVFYNNFLKENEGLITLSYPHTSTKISRTMDGTELTTKLYVSDVEDDSVYDGYHSIMNAEANPTRENYILNFDYLHDIGTISDEQYAAIGPYKVEMGKLNRALIQAQQNLAAYQERKPKLEAKAKNYQRGIDAATTQLTQNNAIILKIAEDTNNTGDWIQLTEDTPDRQFVKTNTKTGESNYIVLSPTHKGVDPDSIKIYTEYNYTDKQVIQSSEISGFNPVLDEYGNLVKVENVPQQAGFAPVFVLYKYQPIFYYQKIQKVWRQVLGDNTTYLHDVEAELGTADYDPTTGSAADEYATLQNIINNAVVSGTIETDYFKRPHIATTNVVGDIVTETYLSKVFNNVLVSSIAPNSMIISDSLLSQYVSRYLSSNSLDFSLNEINGAKSSYTFRDIFMGKYATTSDANVAANAYHNYHEAVMSDQMNGVIGEINKCTAEIEGLINTKNTLIKEFEELMGPALREGYWQPENYKDFGDKKMDSKVLTATNIGDSYIDETGDSFELAWETAAQEGEQDIFYYNGVSVEKVYYPCINLSTLTGILPDIEKYSFIFNNTNMIDSDENDMRNIQIYKVGANAILMYIASPTKDAIYPALVLTGAKTLDANELARMKDPQRGHPRLGIVNVNTDSITGLSTTTITNKQYISSGMWTFAGQTPDYCFVAYPRAKFSSLALRTESTNLIIHYGATQLDKYTDYSVLSRMITKSSGDHTAAYFITFKPDVIMKNGGLGQTVKINYVLSNANTAIYIDGLQVSEENAKPKVSYEITPNLLGNYISQTLYNRLAQIVMINDVELKFDNVFGYISELTLDLDDTNNDSIVIANYKTKFEDLFSTIIAQTEAMKFGSKALEEALEGDIPLSETAWDETLQNYEGEIRDYIAEFVNEDQLLEDRFTEIFNELGEVIFEATHAQENLHVLSTQNATVLNSLAENIGDSLSTHTYRSQTKPQSYKFGDTWIQTDASGREIARYIATSSNDNSDPTLTDSWGFAQTYDGTLAEIRGAHLGYNAATGIVDIAGEHRINMRSGHDVYIAANDRVNIVGNQQVNIGGTEVNICSLREINSDGTQGALTDVAGINLIAGTYDEKNDTTGTVSKVLISPAKVEFGSSDILMKSASSIKLITSTGNNAGTAGVLIGADTGISLSSGAGIRMFGGKVSDDISIGPAHRPKFKEGDVWIKTSASSQTAAHNSYDGDGAINTATKDAYYYSNHIRANDYTGDFTIIGKYRASKDWNSGEADADIWVLDNSISYSDYLIKGASVELDSTHLLMGFDAVSMNNTSSTVMEMNQKFIILSTSSQYSTDIVKAQNDQHITGFESNGITGVLLRSDFIGMGLQIPGNGMSIFTMAAGKLTLASGIQASNNPIDFSTASSTAIRTFVQNANQANNSTMSYVRIAGDGIELGSYADFFVDTTNFKLVSGFAKNDQTGAFITPLTQHTVMAFGSGANGITYDMNAAQIIAYNAANEAHDVHFAVTDSDAYIKGNIVATSLTLLDPNASGQYRDMYNELLRLQNEIDGVVDSWWGNDNPMPQDAEFVSGSKDTIMSNAGFTEDEISAIHTNTVTQADVAYQWIQDGVEARHTGDIFYNKMTGATFRWTPQTVTQTYTYTYAWRWVDNNLTLTNMQNSIEEGAQHIQDIVHGDLGLAFQGTGPNVWARLDNTFGLVMIGEQINGGTFNGKYPFFRASNNAMGFFVADNYTAAYTGFVSKTEDDEINPDKALMYYYNGNMYLAGTLFANRVYVQDVGADPELIKDYIWHSITDQNGYNYMNQVNTTLQAAVTDAVHLYDAARAGATALNAVQVTSGQWLASLKQEIVTNYLPTVTTAATHPAKFKVGDIWKTSTAEYTAMYNWDEVYSSEADANNNTTSTKGWNKTKDGTLANIVGTKMEIDTETGNINIQAESTIALAAKLNLTLTSNDIEITGNHSVKIGGGTSVEISAGSAANSGEVRILATGASGNSAILMSPSQLKIGSAANIIIESGSSVLIRANAQGVVNAVQMDQNGIQMGSSKTITFTSTSELKDDGTGAGSIFSLQPDRLMFGFSSTNSSATQTTNTNFVRIDQEQILLAAVRTSPDLATYAGVENGEITNPSDNTINLSGVQIRNQYIGMVAYGSTSVGLVQIKPNDILLAVADTLSHAMATTGVNESNGSYVHMWNDGTLTHFTVGSTGVFKILTPNILIDSSATTANQDILKLSRLNSSHYLQFTGDGKLNINATDFTVNADSIHLISTGGGETFAEYVTRMQNQFDHGIARTVKWYTRHNSNSTAPTGITTENASGWSTSIPAPNGDNEYLWSVTETIYNNTQNDSNWAPVFGPPIFEAYLTDKDVIEQTVYTRTAENVEPASNAQWSTSVPDRGTPTTPDDQNPLNGRAEKTSTIASPWIWRCIKTTRFSRASNDSERVTYSTPERCFELETAESGYFLVNDIRAGRKGVPVVNSTGVYVKDNDLEITSTGKLKILANGELLIGNSSANSASNIAANNAITMNQNGIVIQSQAALVLKSGTSLSMEVTTTNANGTTTTASGIDMDSTGLFVHTNSRFQVIANNSLFKIDSNPTDTYYILLKKVENNLEESVFSIDTGGNVIISGNVKAKTGYLGGQWETDSQGNRTWKHGLAISSTFMRATTKSSNITYTFDLSYGPSSNYFWTVYDGSGNQTEMKTNGQFYMKDSDNNTVTIDPSGDFKIIVHGEISTVDEDNNSGEFKVKKNGSIIANGAKFGEVWRISPTAIRSIKQDVGMSLDSTGHSGRAAIWATERPVSGNATESTANFRAYTDGHVVCQGLDYRGKHAIIITDIITETRGNNVYVKQLKVIGNNGESATGGTNTIALSSEQTINFTNADVFDHLMITNNTEYLVVGVYDYTGTTTSTSAGRTLYIKAEASITDATTKKVKVTLTSDKTFTYKSEDNKVSGSSPEYEFDATAIYNAGWKACYDWVAAHQWTNAYDKESNQALSGTTRYSDYHSYPASESGGYHTASGNTSWSYTYVPNPTLRTDCYQLPPTTPP